MTTILVILKYFSIALTGVTGLLGLFFNFHEDEDSTGRRRLNRWGRAALTVLIVSLSATVLMQIMSDLEEDSRQSAQMRRQTEMLEDIQKAAYPLTDLRGQLVFEMSLTGERRKKMLPVMRTPGLLENFGDLKEEGSLAHQLGRLSFTLNVGKPIPSNPDQRDVSIYGARFLSNINRLATDHTPFGGAYIQRGEGKPDEFSFAMPLTFSNNSGRLYTLKELGNNPVEIDITYGGTDAMKVCKPSMLYLSSERTGLSYGFNLSNAKWKTEFGPYLIRSRTLTTLPPINRWAMDPSVGKESE